MSVVSRQKQSLARARRDLYRNRILEAAERVFARNGYQRTRMQDIAAEAGISLGTLYSNCRGKEEIFAAIHETRGQELLEHAAQAATGALTPLQALIRGVRAYVEYLVQRPHYLRMHLNEGQPWALSPTFISKAQRAQWERGVQLSVSVFAAGIADGTIVDDEPERLARLMIAAHQVYLVGWVQGGMKEAPDELIEAMQTHVMRAFVRPGVSWPDDAGEPLVVRGEARSGAEETVAGVS